LHHREELQACEAEIVNLQWSFVICGGAFAHFLLKWRAGGAAADDK
jgi:hypothetical protein